MRPKVLLIIPTYNESEIITTFLQELGSISKGLSKEYEISILNVDDNSPDGTAQLASDLNIDNFYQIINAKKIGLGPAYICGFDYGLAKDFELFVEMDADGSHSPLELKKLLDTAANYALVIGTRWMPGGKIINWPKYRMFISKLGTYYASRALKLNYRDLTSGYRVLSREFIGSLDLKSISTRGYGFQIEMAFLAHENGFPIAEVPITFVERAIGRSKMTFGIVIEAFRFVTRLGLSLRFNMVIRR